MMPIMAMHNFHWNVAGPMFNTLHAIFMMQYTELWPAVDPVADLLTQYLASGQSSDARIEA